MLKPLEARVSHEAGHEVSVPLGQTGGAHRQQVLEGGHQQAGQQGVCGLAVEALVLLRACVGTGALGEGEGEGREEGA